MIQEMLDSLQAYRQAFGLLSKLRLWKYFAVPMLITFLTAVTIVTLAWGLSDNIGGIISKAWIWEWGSETVQTISNIVGGLIVLALGLVIYKHIVMALSAPFMSPVSEKIEAHFYAGVHKHRDTTNFRQLIRGIKINVRNLLWETALTIPILILSLIPVVGIFSTILIFLIQAYYAGFGNMDYTLERHFDYRDSVKFVKKHRGAAIGNGMIFTLILFFPFIGILFVLPISVTAASVITLELLNPDAPQKSETAKA